MQFLFTRNRANIFGEKVFEIYKLISYKLEYNGYYSVGRYSNIFKTSV